MRRTFAILCLLAGLATAPLFPARAQDNGGQQLFVEAFLIVRKGEEDERNGKMKDAMMNYRTAANMLTKVKQTWPKWQTEIVEFRLRRTMDAIERLQTQMGGAGADIVPPIEPLDVDKGAIPEPPPTGDIGLPPLTPPDDEGPLKPTVIKRPGKGAPARPVSPAGSLDIVRDQIAALENQVQTMQDELKAEREKNAQLAKELDGAMAARKTAETAQKKAQDLADVYQAQMLDIKSSGDKNGSKAKELEAQLAEAKKQRDSAQTELAAATEREEQLTARAKALAAKAQEAAALPDKIKSLENTIADERKKNEGLAGKVATLTKERDDARLEITKLKDLNKQTDKLLEDNAALLKKLGDAEKQILAFKADSVDKEQAIANLQKQVAESQKALASSDDRNLKLSTEIGDLQKKVGDYSKQIQQFKADKTASTEEQKRMTEENRLLQGIVMRVLQEDANRAQRKKMIQKEMDKLHIQSDVLLKQIGFLTQPVMKLSTEERKLFKKPELIVQDPNTLVAVLPSAAPATEPAAPATEPQTPPSAPTPDAPKTEPKVEAPMPEKKPTEVAKLETPPKKMDDLPKKEPVDIKPDAPKTEGAKSGINAGVQTAAVPNLPDDVKPLAEQAKAAFDREKYPDAERLYDKALQLVPNNLYLLSNRGVVQFRSGKLKQAEDSFRKALAIAPEDSFCWCTLGIVYYSQGKYDEAVNALTKSLAINSKNATAHNYLGITAAQKGWMEAAQKELETALQLDEKYADAWFNLAVVMATKTPPNKPEAKKCYDKAVELGAEADPAMEALVK
jgi:Flp pilus assembly protein TadD